MSSWRRSSRATRQFCEGIANRIFALRHFSESESAVRKRNSAPGRSWGRRSRLGEQNVRAGQLAEAAVGARRDFGFRFQTNNYAIRSDRVPPRHILKLSDHVDGSAYADSIGLTDVYFDELISATNKTPCSASALAHLLHGPESTIAMVRRYVDGLRSLHLPSKAAWIEAPLGETLRLFDDLIASARTIPRPGWTRRLRSKLGLTGKPG